MTKIKLIASDLDGTLLQNGAQNLGEGTCGLIHKLNEKGIRFIAASGRQLDNLRMLFEPVKDEIAYVCQNGASSYADGTRISFFPMDEALGRELVEEIRSVPGLEVFVSQFDCCYVDRGNDAFYHHVKDVVRMNVRKTDDVLDAVKGCSKISIYEEQGLSDIAYWQKRYGSRCTVVTGGEQWLDIMPQGINKRVSLELVLDHLHIDPKTMMVFGDNLNDIEMLEYAGCACAVRNAAEEVLRKADVVCDAVEEVLQAVLDGKDRIEDWVRN